MAGWLTVLQFLFFVFFSVLFISGSLLPTSAYLRYSSGICEKVCSNVNSNESGGKIKLCMCTMYINGYLHLFAAVTRTCINIYVCVYVSVCVLAWLCLLHDTMHKYIQC